MSETAAPLDVAALRAEALKGFDDAPDTTTTAPASNAAPATASAAKADAAAVAAPPADAPKGEEPFAKSFEKLAAEKAAFRKEMESAKPYIEAMKALPPTALQAMARSVAQNDPMALLSAAGFTYADVAKRMAGAAPDPKVTENKTPDANSALPAEIKTEIEQLREFRKQFQAQQEMQQRQAILGKVKETLKAEAFPHLVGLEQFDAVLSVINDYHARTGELPGNTPEESFLAAAQVVEKNLKDQAEKWKKVLTTNSAATTVVPVGAKSDAPPPDESGKTLTNRATAPITAASVPTSLDAATLRKSLVDDPNW